MHNDYVCDEVYQNSILYVKFCANIATIATKIEPTFL